MSVRCGMDHTFCKLQRNNLLDFFAQAPAKEAQHYFKNKKKGAEAPFFVAQSKD